MCAALLAYGEQLEAEEEEGEEGAKGVRELLGADGYGHGCLVMSERMRVTRN